MFAKCSTTKTTSLTPDGFPSEMVHFVSYKGNPVFTATGTNTWDNEIRERGYILKEDGMYHLWYTSYTNIDSVKWLGYATSPDGYNWTRYKDNPIYNLGWVEDMCVIKSDGMYYMFAEGQGRYCTHADLNRPYSLDRTRQPLIFAKRMAQDYPKVLMELLLLLKKSGLVFVLWKRWSWYMARHF